MKKISKLLFLVCIISMLLSLASCAVGNKDDKGSALGGADKLDGSGAFGNSTEGSTGTAGDYSDYGDVMDGGYASGGHDPIKPPALDGLPDGGADSDSPDGETKDETEEPVKLPSGMITASAWNDNDNYKAWLDLFMQSQESGESGKFYDYTRPENSRGYNSLDRVKVSVTDGEKAIAGAKAVATSESGEVLFSAVTDAKGVAYLFPESVSGTVTVTSGEESTTLDFTKDSRELEAKMTEGAEKLNVIEIMLVVDVTGSMGDEIYFLKAELADVINRIRENDSEAVIKLAMLFYRDTEDLVPFDYYDFVDVTNKSGLDAQQAALDRQYASGGGDYPEAVDEALSLAVSKQWSTGATTKIIFHVLDAPAHDGDQYAEKLANATKSAAEQGIRICPIICSGAAGETEYTMREAAVYTGGTFVFVTDDSGIGGSHHDPDLPNTTVELLNSLMVRLVNGYHTGDFTPPVYWKEDPNLNVK